MSCYGEKTIDVLWSNEGDKFFLDLGDHQLILTDWCAELAVSAYSDALDIITTYYP